MLTTGYVYCNKALKKFGLHIVCIDEIDDYPITLMNSDRVYIQNGCRDTFGHSDLLPCYLIKKQIQNKSDMSYGITYSHQIFEGEKFEKFMMFGVKNNYFKYEVIDG